ncbi:MAG: hypothetical protein ACYDCL_20750 [Myxococcales bacterium]
MRFRVLALGGLLAACSGAGSAADAGGRCTLDSECPAVGCQCSGGVSLPSACLCEGGKIAATGDSTGGPQTVCGPGGVCATASDCGQACAQQVGLGGTSGGGGAGGSGGAPCASDAECRPLACACPDAGSTELPTYCVQGSCEPASQCPSC